MEHTLITILIIALVAGVCLWLTEKIAFPEPMASGKWIAQVIIVVIAIVALLRLI